MKFSVQIDRLKMLEEAVRSNCDKVRFGSEFCEWKIPSLESLEKAYTRIVDRGKDFVYVTPRVSDSGIKKIRKHLDFLNRKRKIDVIINDLGTLNILQDYSELKPFLGRQLVHVPARCPWLKIGARDAIFLWKALRAKRSMKHVEELYSQTSLNYKPTIQLFQSFGVQGLDVDWIPRCFPYFNSLVKAGLNISLHLHLIPVTLTRKCHTARFLGEKSPETCSKPCDDRAFLLKHKGLNLELFLHGNALFSFTQPSKNDLEDPLKNNVTEFVITMNPITKVSNRHKIDALIRKIINWS